METAPRDPRLAEAGQVVLSKTGNIVAVVAGGAVTGYSMQHQDPWLVALGLGVMLIGSMAPQRVKIAGVIEFISRPFNKSRSARTSTSPSTKLDAKAQSATDDDLQAWQKANQESVFRYVAMLTGDQRAAYQLSADAFEAVRAAWPPISRPKRLRAVLRKATGLVERGLDKIQPAADDPVPKEVRETLIALPFWQRAAVLLKNPLGLDDAEIASVLERSVADVRKNLPAVRDAVNRAFENSKTVSNPPPQPVPVHVSGSGSGLKQGRASQPR